MTTVAKDDFGGGEAERPAERAARGPGRAAGGRGRGVGKRVWQIPLLLAGLAAFGFGVRSLVRAIRPVPFATQVTDIRGLLAAGENVKAIQQINAIGNYYLEPRQQAQLQWLAGDAHYLAEVKQGGGDRDNFAHAAEHYQKAVALGAVPTPLMNERWGLAALATGDAPLAIEKLEAAGANDPDKLLEHAHELVAAYLATGKIAKAQDVVDRVLAAGGKAVSVDDRAWGYGKKIEMALLARRGGGGEAPLLKAVAAAKQAVTGMPERDPSGRVLLWIGRAEFEGGNLAAAKADLEAARSRFLVHHLDDGRAAVLLGKIALAQHQLEHAADLFHEVVTGQAGTPVWAAARFGRAQVLAAKDEAGDAMKQDDLFVIQALQDEAAAADNGAATPADGEGGSAGEKADGGKIELVNLGEVQAGLEADYERYINAGNLQGALQFLALLGEIKQKESAARAWALATTREARALQIERDAATMKSGGKGQADALLKLAAEDYLRHAKLTTLQDDISGTSLWKAAQLLDVAGETTRSIEVYDRFTSERPRDPRVPEGLLAIGRLYQSIGAFDKAIPVYQRNIEKNPKTPAAYTSAVNLARCYMMQGTAGEGGEANFKKAEAALLSLVQDNGDILPTADEYRLSLFTLGELYYRNDKWADAILRLEECVERYPDDKGIPRAQFMLAETYRKSAAEIQDALKKDAGADNRAELAKARTDRLEHAADLFGQVIRAYDGEGEGRIHDSPSAQEPGETPLSPLEKQYLRSSYMDRAGCYFALKDYPAAIKLYDLAATRFSMNVLAVEAYVQIVNSYQALGQKAQAAAAAERGRWVLKRIPEVAFGKGAVPLTRAYYEDLLRIAAGDAGSPPAGTP